MCKARYQIRILCLHQGIEGTVVKCHLETVNLTDGPRFIAVSYEWGDPNPTTNIIVNGVDTSLTENLQKALLQLRAMKVERVRADAVCINQSDNREESLQVRLMKQIYSVASQTFAWLGEPGNDGAAAAIVSMKPVSPALSQQSGSNVLS
ncbi:hypothetical protein RRF57_001828 [Xylaria bambusicola]|uniref:Heterokaryon incompatibility domain-containing protein n=1 Tax=Xylaria bambusicola TaxID=326684 RepID=A0AAN7UCK3_9PEZI